MSGNATLQGTFDEALKIKKEMISLNVHPRGRELIPSSKYKNHHSKDKIGFREIQNRETKESSNSQDSI